MSLEQRITDDLTAAMRAGDDDGKRTLRGLRSALQYAAIELGADLDDEAVLAVLGKQAKQRRDSIEQYEKGDRPDLVARERAELEIIEGYLPRQLGADEIEAAARKHIAAAGATSPADMGRVMKPLMAELAGLADGRAVSEIVRRLLAG